MGPVHSQCPQPSGANEETVRPSLPAARYVPEERMIPNSSPAGRLLCLGVLAVTDWQWATSAGLLRCLSLPPLKP